MSNINGLASTNRQHMLEEFIQKHDVDIAVLQEVTSVHNITIKGYQIDNIGTAGHGTATLTRDDLQMHRIRRLPSGQGLAAYYNNICLVNIYAPSGTSNLAEREDFFISEVTDLLPLAPTELIMAGDFNCVQSDSDCTEQRYSSRSLDKVTQGLRLVDVWDASLNAQAFTHYTLTGAARLDRIYVSDSIRKNKQGVETLAAAFTDHLAVILRVQLSIPFTHWGRGRWCMNTSYLVESHFQDKLKIEWTEWKKHIPRYQSIVHW